METRLENHLALTNTQLDDTHDGPPEEVDHALDEATRRAKILEDHQVSCGVLFAQAKSMRSGINIGNVLTSEESKAIVGLPDNVVGEVNLRVGDVTTQGRSTSYVGVYPRDINL
jgi:acetylornithine deacetylase/succinyl-diaminopimelate desuccinylase-like protein